MSGDKDDGGHAFPRGYAVGPSDDLYTFDEGMSLRDWFAGQALAGYFAYQHANHQGAANSETARYCYDMADAMIAERMRDA